jgi:hypothetical protein
VRATQTKLDEAIFFLGQIESNSFNSPHLGYYLSAFISSSRSVLWVMRHEFCQVDGWLEWYESKIPSPEMTRFLQSLNDLRTRAVKKETPSVQYMIDFRIPPGGLTNEKAEWLRSSAGQSLIVTVYTEDEPSPSISTEHGISFDARVDSAFPSVSEFSGDDILKIGRQYVTWLSTLADECEAKFGSKKSPSCQINLSLD